MPESEKKKFESEARQIKRNMISKDEIAVLKALRGTPENGPDFKALKYIEVEKYCGKTVALTIYRQYWDAVFACYYDSEQIEESEKEAFLTGQLETIDRTFRQNLD